jgi:NAD(P)-dependent dehydrogenase (short-subunit alcohol dehydrogenase family)
MDNAALVIGGSGGIGAALVRRWEHDGQYSKVFTSSRHREQGRNKLTLDLSDESSIARAAENLKTLLQNTRLSSIVICSGFLHDNEISPERRLANLNAAAFEKAMTINALGPLLIAKHFSPLLPASSPSRLLALSARVGSISDNRLGGWFSYRCSKAALNQGFQTLAIELGRTKPYCIVTLFHPGTVDTPLSKPFKRNVPQERLFTTEKAAQQLDEVMHARRDPKAPIFVDWAGKPVEF